METTSLNALIGAVAGIVGGLIGAIATWLTGRTKLRHLQIEYEHKLQEKYLENARQYTNGIYVPLSIALSRLSSAFQVLQRYADAESGTLPADRAEAFTINAAEYLKIVTNLTERGADAFLTTQLEEELRAFNDFLEASLSAEMVSVRTVYRASFGVFGFRYHWEKRGMLVGKQVRIWGSGPVEMSLFAASMSYQANEVVAAPLGSAEFSRRFAGNVPALKELIKEVTLGAREAS